MKNVPEEDMARALGHLERGEYPHVFTEDEKKALHGEMSAEDVAYRMATDFDSSMMGELEKKRPKIMDEVFYHMADVTLQDEVVDWIKGRKDLNSRAINSMFNAYGDIRPRKIMQEVVGYLGADFDSRLAYTWGDQEIETSMREFAYLPLPPKRFMTASGNPSYDRLNRALKEFYGPEFNIDRDFFQKKLRRTIMEGQDPARSILEEYGVPLLGERALTEENFRKERAQFEERKAREEVEEPLEVVEEPNLGKPLMPLKTQAVPKSATPPTILKEPSLADKVVELPEKVIITDEILQKVNVPAFQKTLAEIENKGCVDKATLDLVLKSLPQKEKEVISNILSSIPSCVE